MHHNSSKNKKIIFASFKIEKKWKEKKVRYFVSALQLEDDLIIYPFFSRYV